MKKLINRILTGIEEAPISASEWIFGAAGVLFVRFLLENFTTQAADGIIASDAATLVHYFLFFIATALMFSLVGALFVPEKKLVWHKIALFGLIFTWLAPLIDLFGHGKIAYIFDSPAALINDFLVFFGSHGSRGASLGIRIELALVFVAMFLYVRFWAGKSIARGLCAALASYIALFIFGAMPSIIYALHQAISPDSSFFSNPILEYLASAVKNSLIGKNFLHQTVLLSSANRYAEIYFDVAMSQIFYLILVIEAAAYAALAWPEKIAAIVKNSRIERVAHYFLLIGAGIALAAGTSALNRPIAWPDVTSIVILFVSFYFAWMHAVGVNDIEDLEIDSVSNAGRPLVTKKLSQSDIKSANIFFLCMALIGGFIVGHYALYMVIAYICFSHIYSSRPFKLKRVPLLSSFIISLACLSAAMAGYFTLSASALFSSFRPQWAFLIILCFTLGANFRDIKDIEGDKAAGISTIPVLFGETNGKRIIGGLCVLGFLLIPLILGRAHLLIISIPAALASYVLINRRTWSEKPIFILYFIYLILLIAAK